LVGVAVKVTEVPVQMVVSEAEITTAGTKTEFTVIVIVFDVAVVGATHEAVEVITQVMMSLSARPALVYVELFVPTFVPLE